MSPRKMEPGIRSGESEALTYGGYLQLDKLLDAQHPISSPEHHDEMLFIVQHQVTELWFKLVAHELEAVKTAFGLDHLHRAQKHLLRVKRIQTQLYNQWSVLDTLTPSEYAEFRDVFGNASGFQSPQYRLIECLLGAREPELIEMHRHRPGWYQALIQATQDPSVFDAFLVSLCRSGFDIPTVCAQRDFSTSRENSSAVVQALKAIYEDPESYWAQYEICESLMDVSNNFQYWRFHHMKTVERIIGHKSGTGGSSGVAFLKGAMDDEFFPELIQVRTEIGRRDNDPEPSCPFGH